MATCRLALNPRVKEVVSDPKLKDIFHVSLMNRLGVQLRKLVQHELWSDFSAFTLLSNNLYLEIQIVLGKYVDNLTEFFLSEIQQIVILT